MSEEVTRGARGSGRAEMARATSQTCEIGSGPYAGVNERAVRGADMRDMAFWLENTEYHVKRQEIESKNMMHSPLRADRLGFCALRMARLEGHLAR